MRAESSRSSFSFDRFTRGNSMSCTPAARKSARHSRALCTGFSDAAVMPTIGPPVACASSMNEPSASPSGVHAPPMRTSGPRVS
jgi:hypothetical protein